MPSKRENEKHHVTRLHRMVLFARFAFLTLHRIFSVRRTRSRPPGPPQNLLCGVGQGGRSW